MRVRWRLQLDPGLLWRRRLSTKVAIALRVGSVLRRRGLRGVRIVAIGLLIDGLVGRGRTWRWCHPCGACVGTETVGATAASVEASVQGGVLEVGMV